MRNIDLMASIKQQGGEFSQAAGLFAKGGEGCFGGAGVALGGLLCPPQGRARLAK